jgi:aminopeptidase N
MTITHDKNLVAFFNTQKNFHDDVRGKPSQIRDEFEESVQMSTYLVAFVVCDFVVVSKISEKSVNVSVIAAKDKIEQADFALNAATKIMDFYDDFFGVPYPLEKQDLIAIPGIFIEVFFSNNSIKNFKKIRKIRKIRIKKNSKFENIQKNFKKISKLF